VRFAVRRDSGSTFDAAVTVTNTGTEPLTDWRLQFAFAGGQRIVADQAGAAGAVVGQADHAVTVGPADARPLAPGASAHLLVRGRYAGANPLPRRFTVDGRACTASVTGVPPETGSRAGDDRDDVETVTAAGTGGSAKKPRTESAGGAAKKAKAAKKAAKKSGPDAGSPASGSAGSPGSSPGRPGRAVDDAPEEPDATAVQKPRGGGLFSVRSTSSER
jgi:serine/threonine-protein kinase